MIFPLPYHAILQTLYKSIFQKTDFLQIPNRNKTRNRPDPNTQPRQSRFHQILPGRPDIGTMHRLILADDPARHRPVPHHANNNHRRSLAINNVPTRNGRLTNSHHHLQA